MIDYISYNRKLWNLAGKKGNSLNPEISKEQISNARNGEPEIYLVFEHPISFSWFDIKDNWNKKNILVLGGGGGNIAPLLALTGASVDLVDFSKEQLHLDNLKASELNLQINTMEKDFSNLNFLESNKYDLIIHPSSLFYIKDIQNCIENSFRSLKPNGRLLQGIVNPLIFALDKTEFSHSQRIKITNTIPYNYSISDSFKLNQFIEFGHSWQSLIGIPIKAGFRLKEIKESGWGEGNSLDLYFNSFTSTCWIKPSSSQRRRDV